MRYRGASRALVETARINRTAPTHAEEVLWEAIRRRQIANARFRRQHPLGRFIADFCCPEHRLIVEVDGSSHVDRMEYDAGRSEHFAAYGYRVERFSNDQVLNELGSVLDRIASALSTTRAPLPPGGRGEGVGG